MAGESKKDKVIAAILALFLGPLGIHRFYLGQQGMGIGFILGSLTIIGIIPTRIISFVDAIGFLIMPQETFDRRYNSHLYIGQANNPLNIGSVKEVNIADEIHKLDQLFQRGVITFEEFEKRKSRLLNT